MTHKGYTATMIELDEASRTIHGRAALERGMATFEGSTAAEAIEAFRASVEDYLAMCRENGIEPERPSPMLDPAGVGARAAKTIVGG